ncbi:hypothetical protein ABIC02_007681 [Bradyrhizobium sp. RT5a]
MAHSSEETRPLRSQRASASSWGVSQDSLSFTKANFGRLRSAYSGNNRRRASAAMRRAASSFLCFDHYRGLPLRSMGTRMCSTSAKKYLHQPVARKALRSLAGHRPQETSWFSKPYGAWHESVCTRFRAYRQLIAVAGQVCRGKSARGRASSAAQTRFPARSATSAAILFAGAPGILLTLIYQRKRSATASRCWPRYHRWLACHAAVQKLQGRGQKALTKLVAAVGLFLRMRARTSVIAKRWAREAAVFLRASLSCSAMSGFNSLCVERATRIKYFVGRDTSRWIASPQHAQRLLAHRLLQRP